LFEFSQKKIILFETYNPYLTNYGQKAYFWTFFEIIRILAISAVYQYRKKKISIFKKKNRIQMSLIRRLNTFRFKKNKIKPASVVKRFKPIYSSKFLDLHKRTNQIYFNNRYLLKDFFGFNKIRQ
jgi:hypothetical protein